MVERALGVVHGEEAQVCRDGGDDVDYDDYGVDDADFDEHGDGDFGDYADGKVFNNYVMGWYVWQKHFLDLAKLNHLENMI